MTEKWQHAGFPKSRSADADARIVSCLEGGYAFSALGRAPVTHIKALIE